MRARFVIAPQNGGTKTEITSARGGGWLVREFLYDSNGNRTKQAESANVSDAEVAGLLSEDRDFFQRLRLLAEEVTQL